MTQPSGSPTPGWPAPQPPRWYAPPAPRSLRPVHPDHDPRAYIAPLIGTLLAGPVLVLCSMAALISPMATDSCTAHGCHALYWALALAPCLIAAGYAALALAWALPWRRRMRAARIVLSAAAPLLAGATVLVYVNLPAAS